MFETTIPTTIATVGVLFLIMSPYMAVNQSIWMLPWRYGFRHKIFLLMFFEMIVISAAPMFFFVFYWGCHALLSGFETSRILESYAYGRELLNHGRLWYSMWPILGLISSIALW